MPSRRKTVEKSCTRATERYQWVLHQSGGQTYGNQEEIKPLTNQEFERYMSGRVTPAKFDSYIKKYPDTCISLVRQNNMGGWRLNGVGSLEELRPPREAVEHGWVKRVEDFSSVEALRQGQLARTEQA